jgi:hypothetical protein
MSQGAKKREGRRRGWGLCTPFKYITPVSRGLPNRLHFRMAPAPLKSAMLGTKPLPQRSLGDKTQMIAIPSTA